MTEREEAPEMNEPEEPELPNPLDFMPMNSKLSKQVSK